MRVAVLCAPRGHYKPIVEELVKGIRVLGDEAEPVMGFTKRIEGFDAFVCWGWRCGKRFHKMNPHIPVLVMERGYIGDRFHWTSLGWNGLNGRAIFPKPLGENRYFSSLVKPWRLPYIADTKSIESISYELKQQRRYVLILGQVQSDQACVNVNLAYQYRAWADFYARFDLPVKLRPHPKAPAQAYGVSRTMYTRGTLEEDLSAAAWTVSWNSNSSVDSVLAGVPSVTLDKGAMAWDVTSHDVSQPVTMPDRSYWLRKLAWCQWQPAELANGHAWAVVKAVKP